MHIAQRAHRTESRTSQSDQLSVDFARLCGEAKACRTCPSMEGAVRVLGWANGSPEAQVMFIGEAPGRLGADRTAIPFHGDRAGDNFEQLLRAANISRSDVFVTNAILCNPTGEDGNNRPPTTQEILNCSNLLKRQIEIVNPEIVCTLGAAALKSVALIEPHNLTIRDAVRSVNNWSGRKLIPLYHPGQRAMVHRNFVHQTADYYFVAEQIRRAGTTKAINLRPIPAEVDQVLHEIVSLCGPISLFKAHKILYIMEYEARKNKETFKLNFIRQKNGPYCLELSRKKFNGLVNCKFLNDRPIISLNHQMALFEIPESSHLDAERIRNLGSLTEARLKSLAYLTRPMRRILRLEKTGQNCLNRPIFGPDLGPGE
jgi:uracil-DNA glycosylase family 4